MPLIKLDELLDKVVNKIATADDFEALAHYVKADESGALAEHIHSILGVPEGESFIEKTKWETIAQDIIDADKIGKTEIFEPSVHRIPSLAGDRHFLKTVWFRSQSSRVAFRWAKYAAAVILLFGIGAYLWNNNMWKRTTTAANTITTDVAAPSIEKSTITLANGKTIHLDSVSVGIIATEGKMIIEKMKDGRIVYHGAGDKQMLYNIISVPRGSKTTSLTLADGTIVFLNTASSLKYPVAFADNERRVEITGEAYFEVAKDAKKKFIVKSDNLITEVLGTHFNVNMYRDESIKHITLLEGSIKVSHANKSVMVRPGDQAIIQNDRNININKSVDLNRVMAWKNGLFDFNDMSAAAALKQISRWYNLEIIYTDGIIPDIEFGGTMGRDLKLSQVINMLQGTGLNCKIEPGNRLIVNP